MCADLQFVTKVMLFELGPMRYFQLCLFDPPLRYRVLTIIA
jgi:hypothetical protein